MRISELENLGIDDLRDIAKCKKVSSPDLMDKDTLIHVLETYPETDPEVCAKYVNSIEVGELIAFRTCNFKVKSAKVIKRASADRKFLVETKYGKRFLVSFDDILWVNTNGRWPRWIYNLMKGIEDAKCKTTDRKSE